MQEKHKKSSLSFFKSIPLRISQQKQYSEILCAKGWLMHSQGKAAGLGHGALQLWAWI